MKGKVLVIEDVADIANMVARYLSREGFEVKSVPSAEDAFALIATWKCNLIILDINLPGMDGFEFLSEFTKTNNVPVFILTARTSEEDQLIGLGIGADEYVTKPFSAKVLAMRVRAMFRRMGMIEPQPSNNGNCEPGRQYNFGPYILDVDAKMLKKGNTPIALAAKEYALLAFLAENHGKHISQETIFSKIWEGSCGDISTVPAHIQRIRRKIEDDPARPAWLITTRGMGYRLDNVVANTPPNQTRQ